MKDKTEQALMDILMWASIIVIFFCVMIIWVKLVLAL